jgi:hypothetical protein
MYEVIPEGKSGDAEISHFTVSEEESRCLAHRGAPPPGKYCRLMIGNGWGPMMSDTPAEQRTNVDVVEKAHGNVLIAGLGIGMILVPILDKQRVRHVTVVEKSADVIKLVMPALREYLSDDYNTKLVVEHKDIFAFEPDKTLKWDTIYLDIWPHICTDNLVDITKLKRKFAKRLNRDNPQAWMGAWVEDELRAKKRTEKYENQRMKVADLWPE